MVKRNASNIMKYISLFLLFTLFPHLGNSKSQYDHLIKSCTNWPANKLMRHGDKSLYENNKEKAMVFYMMICSKNHKKDSLLELSEAVLAHIKIGDIYYGGSNYANALEFYLKGLRLCESAKEQPYVAVLYKNVGNVYSAFNDYEKGIACYKIGLEKGKQYADHETTYKIYQNLIGAYLCLNDIRQARRYYEEAKKARHKVTDVSKFMDGFTQALLIAAEKKEPEKAIRQFHSLALFARERSMSPRYECSSYEEIYKTYMQMDENDSTIKYLKICRDLALHSYQSQIYIETYKHLAEIFARLGKSELSFQNKTKYLILKDSLFNERKYDAVRNQQFLYEMEKIGNRITQLQQQEEQKGHVIRRQRFIIGGSILAIITFLALLRYAFGQNKKLNQSYQNLYSLNKRLIEIHQMEKEKLIAASQEPRDETEKYKKSNLNIARKESLLEAIVQVMESTEEYCNGEFSLERLAALVNSNSKYVSQVINETFGKSFTNYINEYRINLACIRLADRKNFGSLTIKAIGESVGYKSHTTFINVFRKMTGMTPSIYQKMAKEDSKMAQ